MKRYIINYLILAFLYSGSIFAIAQSNEEEAIGKCGDLSCATQGFCAKKFKELNDNANFSIADAKKLIGYLKSCDKNGYFGPLTETDSQGNETTVNCTSNNCASSMGSNDKCYAALDFMCTDETIKSFILNGVGRNGTNIFCPCKPCMNTLKIEANCMTNGKWNAGKTYQDYGQTCLCTSEDICSVYRSDRCAAGITGANFKVLNTLICPCEAPDLSPLTPQEVGQLIDAVVPAFVGLIIVVIIASIIVLKIKRSRATSPEEAAKFDKAIGVLEDAAVRVPVIGGIVGQVAGAFGRAAVGAVAGPESTQRQQLAAAGDALKSVTAAVKENAPMVAGQLGRHIESRERAVGETEFVFNVRKFLDIFTENSGIITKLFNTVVDLSAKKQFTKAETEAFMRQINDFNAKLNKPIVELNLKSSPLLEKTESLLSEAQKISFDENWNTLNKFNDALATAKLADGYTAAKAKTFIKLTEKMLPELVKEAEQAREEAVKEAQPVTTETQLWQEILRTSVAGAAGEKPVSSEGGGDAAAGGGGVGGEPTALPSEQPKEGDGTPKPGDVPVGDVPVGDNPVGDNPVAV